MARTNFIHSATPLSLPLSPHLLDSILPLGGGSIFILFVCCGGNVAGGATIIFQPFVYLVFPLIYLKTKKNGGKTGKNRVLKPCHSMNIWHE